MRPYEVEARLAKSVDRISALMIEDYLGERASGGDRARFERAMSKVAGGEPVEYDRV